MAHELAERGIRVFPIGRNSKLPAIPNPHPKDSEERKSCKGECGLEGHGFKDATTDHGKIDAWANRFKGCNFGVATGNESGVIVIDIDGPEGQDWFDSLWVTPGAAVETPSGGRHYYYAPVDDAEYKSTVKNLHPEVDTRIEGGYVVAPGGIVDGKTYTGTLPAELPPLPAGLARIIPLVPELHVPREEVAKGERAPLPVQPGEKPSSISEPEKRVLRGITDSLDALPRPWVKGAGYHHVQFNAACFLHRIARSPHYATDEKAARALFMAHAPVRDSEGGKLRQKRWDEARDVTDGEMAEPPGDTPVLLDPFVIIDNLKSTSIERMVENVRRIGDVKDLIRECRREGLTEQEAYTLATHASDAVFRKAGQKRAIPQWGNTRRIYSEGDEPIEVELPEESVSLTVIPKEDRPRILSDAEADIVENTPNFIDRYVFAAKRVLKEPNKPLHWMNAWAALSFALCDQTMLGTRNGFTGTNMYFLPISETASGKGDAKNFLISSLADARKYGIDSIDLGDDLSDVSLRASLIDRTGESAVIFADEASRILDGFNDPKSYYAKLKDMILLAYDHGKVRAAGRAGMTADERGQTSPTNLNIWFQTTWTRATEALSERDIESGLIGRFIPAIGYKAKITTESLEMQFADEFEVSAGGRHPLVVALSMELKEAYALPKRVMRPASREVALRHVQMRQELRDHYADHPLMGQLEGIFLRLGVNIMKGAALIASVEGRSEVEMTDLLVAARSAEYWARDMVALAEEISSSTHRRQVEKVVAFIKERPRTDAQIYRHMTQFRQFEVAEFLARGEIEKVIKKEDGKWISM